MFFGGDYQISRRCRSATSDPIADLRAYLSGDEIMINWPGSNMNTKWENRRAATLEELASRVVDAAR